MGPPRKVSGVDRKAGPTLFLNAHLPMRQFPAIRIVVTTRSSEPYQTLGELERSIEGIAKAMPVPARAGFRHIIDMRLGPTRVHPSLDPAFERLRRETNV